MSEKFLLLILTLGNFPFFSTEFIKLVDSFANVFLFTVVVFAFLVLVVLLVFVTFTFDLALVVALRVLVLALVVALNVLVLVLKLPDKALDLTLLSRISQLSSKSFRLCELTLLMLKNSTTNKVKNIILFLIVTPHFFLIFSSIYSKHYL